MKDFSTRFVEVVESLGQNGYKLDGVGCITKQKISNIKNGVTDVKTEVVAELCKTFPKVNANYILTGNGSMFLDEAESPRPIMNFEKGKPYYNVDFMCGFDLVENDQTANPDCLIWFPMYDKADCWCNATGMSMYPDICPGDIIALKEVQDFKSYIPLGEIYGVVTKEHRTIKKVCKSEIKGCIKLVPTNQSKEFSEQDIPLNMIVRVYKVLGSLRKF